MDEVQYKPMNLKQRVKKEKEKGLACGPYWAKAHATACNFQSPGMLPELARRCANSPRAMLEFGGAPCARTRASARTSAERGDDSEAGGWGASGLCASGS